MSENSTNGAQRDDAAILAEVRAEAASEAKQGKKGIWARFMTHGANGISADFLDKPDNLDDSGLPADSPRIPTDLTETTDRTEHTVTHQVGHEVTIDSDEDTRRELQGKFDSRVKSLILAALAEREARENIRANHRNLNRMLTLFGAIAIGVVVTYLLTHGDLGQTGKTLGPYSFVITVTLDSMLALYAFIRHY